MFKFFYRKETPVTVDTLADGSTHAVYPCGGETWCDAQGKFHRVDGPAVIYPCGSVMHYRHGVWHNESGPAVVYASGVSIWYVDGKETDRQAPEGPREKVRYVYIRGVGYPVGTAFPQRA